MYAIFHYDDYVFKISQNWDQLTLFYYRFSLPLGQNWVFNFMITKKDIFHAK